jgi:hypothetical protein
MARVKPDATAFVARDAHYIMNVHGRWSDRSDDERVRTWARRVFEETAPHATGSGYVNFLTEDEGERVAASYGTNYPRLQAVSGIRSGEPLPHEPQHRGRRGDRRAHLRERSRRAAARLGVEPAAATPTEQRSRALGRAQRQRARARACPRRGARVRDGARAAGVPASSAAATCKPRRGAPDRRARRGVRQRARGRLHLAAIDAVLGDDYERAKARLPSCSASHPRDVLALQVAHAFPTTSPARRRACASASVAVLPAWSPDAAGPRRGGRDAAFCARGVSRVRSGRGCARRARAQSR